MMALKCADIEDIVVEYDKSFFIGLRVGINLLHIFEFDVEFWHRSTFIYKTA